MDAKHDDTIPLESAYDAHFSRNILLTVNGRVNGRRPREVKEDDDESINDLRDYKTYQTRRCIFISVLAVIVIGMAVFLTVYFTRVHKKAEEEKKCELVKQDDNCRFYLDIQTEQIVFTTTSLQCQERCMPRSTCAGVFYFRWDGECWLIHTDTSGTYNGLPNLDHSKLDSCEHHRKEC